MKINAKKIIHIMQYIIILILIFLIALIAYQKFVLKKKNVSFLNHNFFIILSGSMEPTINIKDLIVTSPKENYNVGDIIAFYESDADSITVHRISDIQLDGNGDIFYITKGDNNNTIDSHNLYANNIIGAYKFKIPILGSIVIFCYNNPILFFTIIVALIILIAIFRLIKNNIEIRNSKNEPKA